MLNLKKIPSSYNLKIDFYGATNLNEMVIIIN